MAFNPSMPCNSSSSKMLAFRLYLPMGKAWNLKAPKELLILQGMLLFANAFFTNYKCKL